MSRPKRHAEIITNAGKTNQLKDEGNGLDLKDSYIYICITFTYYNHAFKMFNYI